MPTSPTETASPARRRRETPLDGGVEIDGQLVQVAGRHPPLEPPPRHVDDQAHPAVERHGQRLRPAHPAAPAGDGQRAAQGAPELLVGDGRERLVGALQDPLGADVDPRPGGHLPVHRQAEPLEPPELRPGRPVADQVRVGDQHPRRPLVGAQHADRPPGLHEQGLVVAQRRQRAHQRVERRPVARRAPGAAVDDEVVGPLGDVRVEVVLQHPQRRLGLPGPGGQRGAAGGPDRSRAGHDSAPTATVRFAGSAGRRRRGGRASPDSRVMPGARSRTRPPRGRAGTRRPRPPRRSPVRGAGPGPGRGR